MTDDKTTAKIIHDSLVNGYFIDHIQNVTCAIGKRVSILLRREGLSVEADNLMAEVKASGDELERKVRSLRRLPTPSDDLDVGDLIDSLKGIGIEPLIVDENTTEEQFEAYMKRMER